MGTIAIDQGTSGGGNCVDDSNFATICSFLENFGETCNIGVISFSKLQHMLEDTTEVAQELGQLHIVLLRRIYKSINTEKWEKHLAKFCHSYNSQDAWEIERFGYKKAKIQTKLRLLKNLMESQFDYNVKFKNEVNKRSADVLRRTPLGRDSEGQLYWYQVDAEANLRIYREDVDDDTWELVATSREQMAKLIQELTDGVVHRNVTETEVEAQVSPKDDMSSVSDESGSSSMDEDDNEVDEKLAGDETITETTFAASVFKESKPNQETSSDFHDSKSGVLAQALKPKHTVSFLLPDNVPPVLKDTKPDDVVIIVEESISAANFSARVFDVSKKPGNETSSSFKKSIAVRTPVHETLKTDETVAVIIPEPMSEIKAHRFEEFETESKERAAVIEESKLQVPIPVELSPLRMAVDLELIPESSPSGIYQIKDNEDDEDTVPGETIPEYPTEFIGESKKSVESPAVSEESKAEVTTPVLEESKSVACPKLELEDMQPCAEDLKPDKAATVLEPLKPEHVTPDDENPDDTVIVVEEPKPISECPAQIIRETKDIERVVVGEEPISKIPGPVTEEVKYNDTATVIEEEEPIPEYPAAFEESIAVLKDSNELTEPVFEESKSLETVPVIGQPVPKSQSVLPSFEQSKPDGTAAVVPEELVVDVGARVFEELSLDATFTTNVQQTTRVEAAGFDESKADEATSLFEASNPEVLAAVVQNSEPDAPSAAVAVENPISENVEPLFREHNTFDEAGVEPVFFDGNNSSDKFPVFGEPMKSDESSVGFNDSTPELELLPFEDSESEELVAVVKESKRESVSMFFEDSESKSDDTLIIVEDPSPDSPAPTAEEPEHNYRAARARFGEPIPDYTSPFLGVSTTHANVTSEAFQKSTSDHIPPFFEESNSHDTIPAPVFVNELITAPAAVTEQPLPMESTPPVLEEFIPDERPAVLEESQSTNKAHVFEELKPDDTIMTIQEPVPEDSIPVVVDSTQSDSFPVFVEPILEDSKFVLEESVPDERRSIFRKLEPEIPPVFAKSKPKTTIVAEQGSSDSMTLIVEQSAHNAITVFQTPMSVDFRPVFDQIRNVDAVAVCRGRQAENLSPAFTPTRHDDTVGVDVIKVPILDDLAQVEESATISAILPIQPAILYESNHDGTDTIFEVPVPDPTQMSEGSKHRGQTAESKKAAKKESKQGVFPPAVESSKPDDTIVVDDPLPEESVSDFGESISIVDEAGRVVEQPKPVDVSYFLTTKPEDSPIASEELVPKFSPPIFEGINADATVVVSELQPIPEDPAPLSEASGIFQETKLNVIESNSEESGPDDSVELDEPLIVDESVPVSKELMPDESVTGAVQLIVQESVPVSKDFLPDESPITEESASAFEELKSGETVIVVEQQILEESEPVSKQLLPDEGIAVAEPLITKESGSTLEELKSDETAVVEVDHGIYEESAPVSKELLPDEGIAVVEQGVLEKSNPVSKDLFPDDGIVCAEQGVLEGSTPVSKDLSPTDGIAAVEQQIPDDSAPVPKESMVDNTDSVLEPPLLQESVLVFKESVSNEGVAVVEKTNPLHFIPDIEKSKPEKVISVFEELKPHDTVAVFDKPVPNDPQVSSVGLVSYDWSSDEGASPTPISLSLPIYNETGKRKGEPLELSDLPPKCPKLELDLTSTTSAQPNFFVGEAIEEEVMFIQGEGSGVELEGGNVIHSERFDGSVNNNENGDTSDDDEGTPKKKGRGRPPGKLNKTGPKRRSTGKKSKEKDVEDLDESSNASGNSAPVSVKKKNGRLPAEVPTRQSSRIAKIQEKEEEQRRRLEEERLAQLKAAQIRKQQQQLEREQNLAKGLPVDEETPLSKKGKGRPPKVSKYVVTASGTESEDEAQSGVRTKKRGRKRKHEEPPKTLMKKGLNPWIHSSSEEDDEVVEEEEDHDAHEEEEEELEFQSDHEFSPESDLEEGEEAFPSRHARTVKRGSKKFKVGKSCEEKEDKYAETNCDKCGQGDHPEWILLCDSCDKGWHASCLKPLVWVIPEGQWFCPPCQHKMLVDKLTVNLVEYDKVLKKHELELLRKQRLAYVGISLDNVLPQGEEDHSGKHVKKRKRRQISSDEDELMIRDDFIDEREESSGLSHYNSEESEDEPMYKLRARRTTKSFNCKEYDEMIKSAIRDEDEYEAPVLETSVGPLLETSAQVNGDSEDEPLPPKLVRSKGKVMCGSSDEEDEEEKRVETSDEEGIEEIEQDRRKELEKQSHRKGRRRLNDLDATSDEDSDDDFKGSDEDEEEDEAFVVEEDDSEWSGDREEDESDDSIARKGKKKMGRHEKYLEVGSVRRSCRRARSRVMYDESDQEDDDDEPAGGWDSENESGQSTGSESDDETWGRKKKKGNPPPSKLKKSSFLFQPSKLGMKGTKKGRSTSTKRKKKEDEDDVDRAWTKHGGKVKKGEGESDSKRSTRGKQIDFKGILELESGESDDDGNIHPKRQKPVPPPPLELNPEPSSSKQLLAELSSSQQILSPEKMKTKVTKPKAAPKSPTNKTRAPKVPPNQNQKRKNSKKVVSSSEGSGSDESSKLAAQLLKPIPAPPFPPVRRSTPVQVPVSPQVISGPPDVATPTPPPPLRQSTPPLPLALPQPLPVVTQPSTNLMMSEILASSRPRKSKKEDPPLPKPLSPPLPLTGPRLPIPPVVPMSGNNGGPLLFHPGKGTPPHRGLSSPPHQAAHGLLPPSEISRVPNPAYFGPNQQMRFPWDPTLGTPPPPYQLRAVPSPPQMTNKGQAHNNSTFSTPGPPRPGYIPPTTLRIPNPSSASSVPPSPHQSFQQFKREPPGHPQMMYRIPQGNGSGRGIPPPNLLAQLQTSHERFFGPHGGFGPPSYPIPSQASLYPTTQPQQFDYRTEDEAQDRRVSPPAPPSKEECKSDGEFGGLVSYFSSQRGEDDMDT